ncbi:hypothetical protein E1293_31825 [Actinomadura darangshiensis]|uniref:Uncharacterized protein n=1 Tax=Actinomadura darangshiensis TaxID=705336 RepID=A0A4R5ANH2_9ACTN|nr:hypothetical protein [Actinomadura darangshiensis]TDD73290.1 hypothetical protein E1293_31825 [Actinomadura darangshiensis]
MTEESRPDGVVEPAQPTNVQIVRAGPGSTIYVLQEGDMHVGAVTTPPFTYADLRKLSDLTAADCDLVAARDDQTLVRLGDGVYVERTVEARLLELLAKPLITLLVGEAGHGKSTVLWHLHDRLSHLGHAPTLVPATALLGEPERRITVDMIAEALRDRPPGARPVLLVDTLDLLLHDTESRRQVDGLLRLARRERLPTLVTSRPAEARYIGSTEDEDTARRGERLLRVTLDYYDDRELREAITAYAQQFYPAEQAGGVAATLKRASLRGLPLQEVCRNPLALRLLFELYAPDRVPPDDIDSIGLHDQFWLRRVVADDRGRHTEAAAGDLSAETEGIGLALLSAGSIESTKPELVNRAAPLAGADEPGMERAVDILRARGVLKPPPRSLRFRFFHQTFFEHVAARSVLASGEQAARQLLRRAEADPHDLFYGEVAAQFLLLADRRSRYLGLPAEVLGTWLSSDDRGLRVLGARTYARMPDPSADLRRTAADMLAGCSLDVALDYLALLPSVHHRTFERAGAELAILWRHALVLQGGAESAKDGASMVLAVLDALARLAAGHPDEVAEFLAASDRLAHFESLPLESLRSRNNLYLRLLEALYPRAPRTWGPVLARFLTEFASGEEVDGAAEILELVSLHPEVILDDSSTTAVIAAVHGFSSPENALRLELAYVVFRRAWFIGLDAGELIQAATAAIAAEGWTTVGRRAEVRALTSAASGLDGIGARDFLDAMLAVRGNVAQECALTVLGETLAADDAEPCPLTQYARERAKAELARLPAERGADGNRPVPMLFVNALYGSRSSGTALLTALPDRIPDEWWCDMATLMPLLVPAALSGHPAAVGALGKSLSGPAGDRRGLKAALGRLRTAAEAGSGDALGYLILHAQNTKDPTMLSATLRRPAITQKQLRSHHGSLQDLRRTMVADRNRGRLAKGYDLWRVLIENGLDDPPSPGELARSLRGSPGYPLLIALLALAGSCMRDGGWAGEDTGSLVEALEPYIAQRSMAAGRKDTPTREAATTEARARHLVIGLRARYGNLPPTPVQRRSFAGTLLELIKDAGYDLSDDLERDALSRCVTELGRLLDRIVDPDVLLDVIHDCARWLHDTQPVESRWRRNVAHAWHPAVIAAVAAASPAQCRSLVTDLLGTDREMARLAVAACVDHIRPIPDWLRALGPVMPDAIHKRMLAVISRNARDGSTRSLPELYDAALTARRTRT